MIHGKEEPSSVLHLYFGSYSSCAVKKKGMTFLETSSGLLEGQWNSGGTTGGGSLEKRRATPACLPLLLFFFSSTILTCLCPWREGRRNLPENIFFLFLAAAVVFLETMPTIMPSKQEATFILWSGGGGGGEGGRWRKEACPEASASSSPCLPFSPSQGTLEEGGRAETYKPVSLEGRGRGLPACLPGHSY